MDESNKKTVMIIGGIVAIGLIIFAGVMFLENYTTDFDTYFISGSIHGVAEEQDLSQIPAMKNMSMLSYKDSDNFLVYEAFAFKGENFYSKILELGGFSKLGNKTYNGVNWEVYSTTNVDNNSLMKNVTSTFSKYNVISCTHGYVFITNKNNVTYVTDVATNSTNASNTTFDFNSDLYKNYVEPYMNSIELKNSDNITSLADVWGISDEQYNLIVQYINNGSFDSFLGSSSASSSNTSSV